MNKLKHTNGNHPLTEKEKQEMIEEILNIMVIICHLDLIGKRS